MFQDMRISGQALWCFYYTHTHAYFHCKMLQFSDLISLPFPDLQVSFHCLFLIYFFRFTAYLWSTLLTSLPDPGLFLSFRGLFLVISLTSLPVSDLHLSFYTAFSWTKLPLHYLFLICIIISLTVPGLQFLFHCLFWSTILLSLPVPDLHYHITYCSWSTVLISLPFLIYNYCFTACSWFTSPSSLPISDLRFSFPLPVSHLQISFHCIFPIHAWIILDRRNSDEWLLF